MSPDAGHTAPRVIGFHSKNSPEKSKFCCFMFDLTFDLTVDMTAGGKIEDTLSI